MKIALTRHISRSLSEWRDAKLHQHQVSGLQRAFYPALGIRIGFAADVYGDTQDGLEDLFLHFPALYPNIPRALSTYCPFT